MDLKLVLKKQWYLMFEALIKKEEYRDFSLGYAKNRPQMTFKCLGIEKGEGREEWGAEKGKCYFIIKLGDRV